MDRIRLVLCALLAVAGASCLGTQSDIGLVVTVNSVSLVRAGGRLTGSVNATITLGSYATASRTIHPQSLDVNGADGHVLGTLTANMPTAGFNTMFAPGDTRTATFPLSCDATPPADCGAMAACGMSSVMASLLMIETSTSPSTPHTATLGATVDCAAP